MPTLTTETSIGKDDLEVLAKTRRREFGVLFAAGEYTGAFYLGGYAIELLLKRAICSKLDLNGLPRIFHVHNPEVLLFFAGLTRELDRDASLKVEFNSLNSRWNEARRYKIPDSAIESECRRMNGWLNGANSIYEWIRAKI